MNLSMFIAGILAMATVAHAKHPPLQIAGNLTGITEHYNLYTMQGKVMRQVPLGNNSDFVKTFGYNVNPGFTCKFWNVTYVETKKKKYAPSVGKLFTRVRGPAQGKFMDGYSAAYYICTRTHHVHSDCGYVMDEHGVQHGLTDSGYFPEKSYTQFIYWKGDYKPRFYKIADRCNCTIYNGVAREDPHWAPNNPYVFWEYELIAKLRGGEGGIMADEKGARYYKCWSKECLVDCPWM